MAQVLATLPVRERQILQLRFGLLDGKPLSLSEIGAKFGLSRERIRQLEENGLRQLRHPSRARQLRAYHHEE